MSMSVQQHLLLKLAEEASEITHIALKTMQFGYDSVKPDTSEKNIIRLREEINDLLAAIDMLNTSCDFNFKTDLNHISRKKEKVNTFLKQSIDLGYVQKL